MRNERKFIILLALFIVICASQSVSAAVLHPASGRVVHYDLYVTDGYVNTGSGVFPTPTDQTLIAGWPKPLYIWGFTDIDPGLPPGNPANLMMVPKGALAPAGGPVGNAKFPAPFIEAAEGDDVYITVHNSGFFQKLQKVQDDHSLHLHGIHAQAQYDGFPESAGSFSEQMRYFWKEPWYIALGSDTKTRDAAWNTMTPAAQQAALTAVPPAQRVYQTNALNPAGGITSALNAAPVAQGGVGGLTPAQVENATQFTYYFRAEHPGTYMYHCHIVASEHVQMGMYGALIIRPRDGNGVTGNIMYNNVYGPIALSAAGAPAGSDVFDKEYTFVLSEIDPNWHNVIEQGKRKAFYPPLWNPELWFVNGRTFPQTIFNFAWNLPAGGAAAEPRYNTYINVQSGQRFLIRYINMGYQEHPMHQHGWHMKVIGTDARPLTSSYEKYTLLIGSGETYDVLVTATPTYGVDEPQGPRLGTNSVDAGRVFNPVTAGKTNFRQIFPIHDHDDYRVTTNGIYPGGALVLMEATGIPNADPATPTWANPYAPPPGFQVVPPPAP